MREDAGRPHRTDAPVPFEERTPQVPAHHPTGVHRRTAELTPMTLRNRQTFADLDGFHLHVRVETPDGPLNGSADPDARRTAHGARRSRNDEQCEAAMATEPRYPDEDRTYRWKTGSATSSAG